MARRDMCATAYSHTHTYLKQTGLLIFNLLFEIPHFWSNFQRVATGEVDTTVAAVGSTTMWSCMQDRDGLLWVKRLPFFFCYFFGCSWSSVAIAYRYLKRGRDTSSSVAQAC